METPNEESPPKSLVIMEKMKHLFEKKLGDALEPIYVGGNHQIHVDDTGMVAVSASKIQLAAFQDALSYAQQKPGPIVLRIDHIGGKETLERFLQAGISPNRESKIYKLAEMCVELQSIFATEAEYNDIPGEKIFVVFEGHMRLKMLNYVQQSGDRAIEKLLTYQASDGATRVNCTGLAAGFVERTFRVGRYTNMYADIICICLQNGFPDTPIAPIARGTVFAKARGLLPEEMQVAIKTTGPGNLHVEEQSCPV